MAVKTFNPAGTSDNWSTAAAWGGVVPADGDSFVISAGKTCYMDTDTSGFATGLIAGTINGTLSGPNGAGTGYIKMDGVAAHDITISANGALVHGTSKASPAAANSIFKIHLGVNSEIYATGNDRTIRLYPTMKTYRHVRLASDAASSATAIVVDQTNATLQADGWQVGDYICLARPTTTSSPSQNLLTIASWGGGSTINVTGSITATSITGSYVVNHSSNIMIFSTSTSGTSEGVFSMGYYCPVFDCGANIVNTGVVTAYTNASRVGVNTYGNTLGRGDFYGSVHGAGNGMNYCRSLGVSGAYFTACTNAIARSIRATLDVRIFACYGASSAFTCECYYPSTTLVFGCCYTLGGQGSGTFFDGKVKGCMEGFIGYDGVIGQNADIGGTNTIDKNSNGDIDFGDGGYIVGQGAMLQSTPKVFSYKTYIAGPNSKSCVALYNYASSVGSPQYGQHYFYSSGGYTMPTTDAGFTALGYPSCEKMIFEANYNLNFFDLPVDIVSGQPFYMVLDVQLGSDAYTFSTAPSIVIVDPCKPFEDAGSVLATAKTSTGGGIDTGSMGIQRLYISYTPTQSSAFPYGAHRPATLRIKGVGGNSGGTGTDYMLFAYSQAQTVVADVQSWGGVAVDSSNIQTTLNKILAQEQFD